MVVKFADTQREKEMKRIQAQRIDNMNAMPGLLGMQAAAVRFYVTHLYTSSFLTCTTRSV